MFRNVRKKQLLLFLSDFFERFRSNKNSTNAQLIIMIQGGKFSYKQFILIIQDSLINSSISGNKS